MTAAGEHYANAPTPVLVLVQPDAPQPPARSAARAWLHPEVVGRRVRAIRSWLLTVTRHVPIDRWRARPRIEELTGDRDADRPDPTERIEQAVTAMDVRAALAQLPSEHRQVIVAMYFHGRSVAEISQSLSIPAGTVKSRVYYGLRQLRRVLSAASGETAQPMGSPDGLRTAIR